MNIKKWDGKVLGKRELINMGAKPINATVEITDVNIIKQIKDNLFKKPSKEVLARNERARNLLRKARRG